MPRNLEIAVIDDDESFRVALVESLSSLSYRSSGYASAEDYLDLTEDKSFNCVVTDIHMPGPMDGLALAHHTAKYWPSVGLLITSARPSPHRAFLPQNSRFLAKPYRHHHVVRHIRELAAA